MEAGFDSAMSAVHNMTSKAGETRLETQTTRQLAGLGNVVFEKISEQRLDDIAEQLEIKDLKIIYMVNGLWRLHLSLFQ